MIWGGGDVIQIVTGEIVKISVLLGKRGIFWPKWPKMRNFHFSVVKRELAHPCFIIAHDFMGFPTLGKGVDTVPPD